MVVGGRTVFFCLGEGINLLVPTIKEIPAHKRNAKIEESKKEGKISQMYYSNTIFMYFLIWAVHSWFVFKSF